MNDDQLFEWLQVCRTLQSLKELTRQGAAAAGFNRGDLDSIAAHTSMVGLMSFTLALELEASSAGGSPDPKRAASLALVHELSSALLGDINSEVKHHYLPNYDRFERLAFQDLVGGLASGQEFLALFDESQTYSSLPSKIARFADGLDAWLEVIPRASLAWMQQHVDYRDRVFEQLKGDETFGDGLAETFLQACRVLETHRVGPWRPGVLPSSRAAGRLLAGADDLVLEGEQLIEWLQVCQTFQRLKRLTRQGFITSGGFNRWDTDSIADHMGLVTLISFTLAADLRAHGWDDVDPGRVVALALVHDLGEAILGDVNSETKRRYFADYGTSERRARGDLLGRLACGDHLLALGDEFDACETTAARIVRLADSLDAWQRVVVRASQTWMPQHVEYRNRTFRKLKGDDVHGDALAELFLRACLILQGEPVGPKRPVSRLGGVGDPGADRPSPARTGEQPDDAVSLAWQVTAEIIRRIRELQGRQQSIKAETEGAGDDPSRAELLCQEGIVQQEIAHAMQTLIGLRGRLAGGETEEI